MKTKTLLYIAVTIGALLTCASFFVGAFFMYFSVVSNFKENTITLEEMVDEVNKQLPIYIDEQTSFDKLTKLSESKIKYTYTLLNIDKSTLTSEEILEFKKDTEEALLKMIREDPDDNFEFFKSNKISIVFEYNDNKQIEIMSVTIPYERYM